MIISPPHHRILRPVVVYLRDTQTGYFATYDDEMPLDDGEGSPAFFWREGNGSCDCNRSNWLYDRCPGTPFPCGESRIRIDMIVEATTGELLYSDWEDNWE